MTGRDGGKVEVVVVERLGPPDGVTVRIEIVRAHEGISVAALWWWWLEWDVADLEVLPVLENDSRQE